MSNQQGGAGTVRARSTLDATSALPMVSVILPARNEGTRIRSCLSALAASTYPADRLEILVVDGESEDNTVEIAQEFQRKGLPVRILTNRQRNYGAALNRGIESARGEMIVLVDGRNRCPPDYIRKCVETSLETGADNVGGVILHVAENPAQLAVGLAMSHPFGVGNAHFRLGNRRGDVASVYLGCLRRSVFDRVGLFDEGVDISPDSEMNLRIRRAGGRVYLDPSIKMPYYTRNRLRDLWRLYRRYGITRAGTLLKYGRLTALRQLVPATFICGLAFLGAASLWNHVFLWGFLALLGIYLVINISVCARLSWAKRAPGLFGRLFLAFPCMHFAFGLAFLSRLARRPRSKAFLRA